MTEVVVLDSDTSAGLEDKLRRAVDAKADNGMELARLEHSSGLALIEGHIEAVSLTAVAVFEPADGDPAAPVAAARDEVDTLAGVMATEYGEDRLADELAALASRLGEIAEGSA